MKTEKHLTSTLFIILLLSFYSTASAQNRGGPYTSDANTILLMHFDGDLNEEASNYAVVDRGTAKTYISNPVPGLGDAISFDNSTQANRSFLTIPYTPELSLTSNWTIEFWFNVSSWDKSHNKWPVPILLPTSGWNANYYLEIPSTDGRLKYGFSSSDGGAMVLSSPNSITTGTWYHVALINDYDNNTIKLILRNAGFEKIEEQSRSYTAGTTISTGTQDLRIGNGTAGDNAFNGYIDELRISNVVREYKYTINKQAVNSENVSIYYDSQNYGIATTMLDQLQNKIDFYKKYFKYTYQDHSKVFSINICKDIDEFNEFKPDDLPEFETSYLYNDILFYISPTTQSQQSYFSNSAQAAMHAFTMTFIDYLYDYNASEWMKYGFARYQSGMKSTPEQIRTEVNTLGRMPTMQEMNDWNNITSFDKYAFAYTIIQYVADVHSLVALSDRIRFSNSSTSYSFWYIKNETEFESVWYYSLDLFYLRETQLLEFQRETDHFYLYMTDEDLPEIDQWSDELEEFYTRFTGDMEMTIGHKIHVLYYPSLCDYHYVQGNTECPVNSVGRKLSIDMCMFTRSNPGDPMMKSMGLAKHELTHVIQGNLDFNNSPRWLTEGLATLMPDGLYTEDIISGLTTVIKEQVIVGFSEIAAAAGRYPTVDDFQSQEFVNQYVRDPSGLYYMLGSVLVDYIIKTSGYVGLKNFIESDAADFTTLGFTDSQDFTQSFYSFYEQNWNKPPRQVSANRIQSPISVDGIISEGEWVLDQEINGVYPFYFHGNNNTAKYGALWDSDYLYVAIEVFDAVLINNSTDGWNDAVEVYVDADFNKAFNYDSFDREFIKGWNDSGIQEKNGLTSGVQHAVQDIDGGYTVEIAIPWSNLGVTPANNKTIGFDIAVVDGDGSQVSHLIWSGNDNNAGTTINFGELTLFARYAPLVSDIPDQSINEGSSFEAITLDDYVTDSDDPDSAIIWSFSGNNDLTVVIDSSRVATVQVPGEHWVGAETITFTATDPSGTSSTDGATFTVVDVNVPPVVLNPPGDIEMLVGGDEFVQDISTVCSDADGDPLSYSATSSDNSIATVTVENTILTVTAVGTGTATITITATDGRGGEVPTSFEVNVPSGVSTERLDDSVPTEYALDQNYPNPFNPTTTIRLALPEAGHVVLRLYSLQGAEIATLMDKYLSPGRYSVSWDAGGYASGVYLYRMEANSYVETKTLTLIK
jgi:Carbohydrate family 9 binding domain-like/Concanavalin A-like lectin/glucanases superfamily